MNRFAVIILTVFALVAAPCAKVASGLFANFDDSQTAAAWDAGITAQGLSDTQLANTVFVYAGEEPASHGPFCTKSTKCLEALPRADVAAVSQKPKLVAVLSIFVSAAATGYLHPEWSASHWRDPPRLATKGRYRLTLAKTGRLLI